LALRPLGGDERRGQGVELGGIRAEVDRGWCQQQARAIQVQARTVSARELRDGAHRV
jgi:hypothetical protein